MDCEVSGLTWDHRPNHSALLMFVTVSLILFAYTIHERGSLWNDKWRPTCETNLHSIVRSCKGVGEKTCFVGFSNGPSLFWQHEIKIDPFANNNKCPWSFRALFISAHYSEEKKKKNVCFVIDVACWVMHMLPHVALCYLCVGNWILNPSWVIFWSCTSP